MAPQTVTMNKQCNFYQSTLTMAQQVQQAGAAASEMLPYMATYK